MFLKEAIRLGTRIFVSKKIRKDTLFLERKIAQLDRVKAHMDISIFFKGNDSVEAKLAHERMMEINEEVREHFHKSS